jgi:predicted dienelactone hydrolase
MFIRVSWRKFNVVAGFCGAIAFSQFLGVSTPTQAAEKVVLRFGLLEETVTLAELQKAAKTGELPESLGLYAGRLSTQQRRFLIGGLNAKVPVNVVMMSRLLNTQVSNTILSDISTAIVRKDTAGVQAIRAGLILGSTAPDGLSVLSFIAAYPSQRLAIDLPQALTVASGLNFAFWRTQQFMLAITPRLDPRQPQIAFPFDPSQPGNSSVEILKLQEIDQKRQRTIPVDVYWSNAVNTDKPVIVFSHGLGSVRTDLRYLAEHLASHGYVVAALEHPGSNQTNTNAAIQGKNRLLKPQEFLERPQDVSFVLDELEKINRTPNHPLAGKLATNKTMVLGYSFGGGTALALAGGEFQIAELKQRCAKNVARLSLGEGVQCIAKELPENSYQLRDNRIKQAIAFNPTTSLLFGETGLTKVQIPTLILASSADKTTPALTEQIVAFTKIPSPKWLVGVLGGTHLSVKDPSTTLDQVGKPNTPFSGGEIVGEKATDVRKFVKSITLAMAAQLTPEANKYAVFLTPDYAQFASTQIFPLRLITEIPPEAMELIQQPENKQP